MIAIQVIIFVVVALIMAMIANRRGFSRWLWTLAGSIPGFIILLCMPSASAVGIDEGTLKRRKASANTVGGIVSVINIIAKITFEIWIFSFMRSGGIVAIPEGKMTWVKCNNPACKAEYEIGLNTYYEEVKKRMKPVITCQKCGKESVYRAFKCQNPDCGFIFIEGSSGANDFSDRCPKCKHSSALESRRRGN